MVPAPGLKDLPGKVSVPERLSCAIQGYGVELKLITGADIDLLGQHLEAEKPGRG